MILIVGAYFRSKILTGGKILTRKNNWLLLPQFHRGVRVVASPLLVVTAEARSSPRLGQAREQDLTISPRRNVTRPELVESASFVTPPPNSGIQNVRGKGVSKMILLLSWMTRETRSHWVARRGGTTISIMYADGVLDEDNLPSTNDMMGATVVLSNLAAVDCTNMSYPHSAGSEESSETICWKLGNDSTRWRSRDKY